MSKKRLFQVLDEMNVNDDVNKTETCACCFDMVGANKVKQGGHVTMGVPAEAVMKILLGEYKPMLVLLDMKVYNSIEKQPVEDRLNASEASVKSRGEIITQLNNRLTNLEAALREVQSKAKRGIFPHLPVETMGAQMCIEIDAYVTDLLTDKTTTMLTDFYDDKKGPKYEVGQPVRTYDEDEEKMINGEITEVGDETIVIKWEDLHDSTEYEISKISFDGNKLIDHGTE